MTEIIDFLKKYTDGKQNTEKVEISVLQLNRVIKALEQTFCKNEEYEKDLNEMKEQILKEGSTLLTKRDLLERFCEITGNTRENMIACGDGFNDISMIKYAGIGVAMANAQDEVKAVADFITASNNDDGVAKVIEKFVM